MVSRKKGDGHGKTGDGSRVRKKDVKEERYVAVKEQDWGKVMY